MTNFAHEEFFKGKKITKQGFGVLGRGFGVVKFLAESGAEVLVTDIKPRENFLEQIKELENYQNIKYTLGEHKDEDFTNCDFVIAGSGIPKDNHFINLAKQNDIPVYQETSLFAKLIKENFKNVKIIGITGTRGKTTTTFLVYELLKKNFGTENVHIGGNVQGVATLELLKKIKENDFVVLELDSWVLQGFGDLKISPDISIFTTFMPDHMNYYKNDLREYFDDKANIFKFQKENNFLVTTEKVQKNLHEFYGENYRQNLNLQNFEIILNTNEIKKYDTRLLGIHNQVLIALVEQVANVLNISKDIFQEVVKNFSGVPGRLEFIKEIEGVKIYNDTCATTPDAVIVAVNSLKEILPKSKKIFLLCGGRDKELSLENLVKKFFELQNILEIFVLNDETTTGSKKLLEEMDKIKVKFNSVKNLQEGILEIKKYIHFDDILLFSPGFASFGMFLNEYDRGDKFNKIILENYAKENF